MGGIYSPLPPGNFIRLLKVRRERDELICNFKVVCLSDCDEEYIALSYAWEDPAPVRILQFDGGKSLSLNQTLSDLIDTLALPRRPFTLWVDALCINQHDISERESQVQLMNEVYSTATKVLLWLGASNAESQAAFRFMTFMEDHSWPDGWEQQSHETLSQVQTVFHLLARPWFRRTWVIQEVVLGDDVVVMCGNDAVHFFTFERCVWGIWKYFEALGDYADDHLAVRGLWNVTRLLDIREEFWEHGEIRFERLVETAYHCEASDPRDMVFGFLGIADNTRPVPEPTYTAPFEDVYRWTAEALLCHGKSLDLLALSGVARRILPSDLPTWVPDLRNRGLEEPLVPCDRASWDAGGPVEVMPTKEGAGCLRLRVKLIDVVVRTCPPFTSNSVVKQQAAMRDILALRHVLPKVISENEWNGVLATSLIMGLDIDDQPAGPEYREYFGEWLQWLLSSRSDADLQNIKGNRFQRTIGPRIDDWKACLTREGYLCMVPQAVEPGEVLCVVPGCRLPILLRSVRPAHGGSGDPRAPEEKELNEYILVSWCFAQGLMYGESPAQRKPATEIFLR
ncbi:uncharacterized protein CTRU02_202362 [Colletotrichum truncatum]|uniref:Uncharacterized protein n=1 Tax=Colletotrichum truncatum TaxID=5467 RepID=A0ACC3ZK88_COLTU|nr:uncharacterized protein CTRU02_01523 [Colletotrichum truncatum]KAF6799844.1 hypothetical protein CTRU02_01523 [Colletotrichum truncatum]